MYNNINEKYELCYNKCINKRKRYRMGKIEEQYENTKNALPHDSVKKFIKDQGKAGKAIDLGCGAGRDTVF